MSKFLTIVALLMPLVLASCASGAGPGPGADVLDADVAHVDNPAEDLAVADLTDSAAPLDVLPDVPADAPADPGTDAFPEVAGELPADAILPDNPPDAPEPAWTACQAASDCVVIELGCCDHCNGGQAFSVNKAHEAEALAALQTKVCDDVDCTALACADLVPTCPSGTCAFESGSGSPCDGLDEAACGAASDCVAVTGAPASQVCNGQYDNWSKVYAGCAPAADCWYAEQCATDAQTGMSLVITANCLPAGWESCAGACVLPNCQDGTPNSFGRVCVHGEASGDNEVLVAGHPVTIEALPAGCHPSGCTVTWKAECALVGSKSFTLEGVVCLEQFSSRVCAEDCDGGDAASCGSGPLEEGTYQLWYGSQHVSFDVPGTLPAGGLCFGT